MHANPNLSVLSHCTTWDRWDCTRDSYVHTLCMQILSVRPIPLYHMGWMGCTGDSLIHTHYACKSSLSILSHCTIWGGWDCTRDSYIHTLCMQILSVRPIPLCHMGLVGLYQGFIRTHTVHANPFCPSYPTVPHEMSRSKSMANTWRQNS